MKSASLTGQDDLVDDVDDTIAGRHVRLRYLDAIDIDLALLVIVVGSQGRD
jgi:hypothetical protein